MTHSPETAYLNLLKKVGSLQLATLDSKGNLRASYAPYVLDEQSCFYIFTSQLSAHTQNLLNTLKASIMVIEDEQDTNQLFARTRANYHCKVDIVDPEDARHESILNLFESQFGNVVELLRSLPDFVLFRLKPESGRFVMGFGQAFDLTGKNLQTLVHVGPDSA